MVIGNKSLAVLGRSNHIRSNHIKKSMDERVISIISYAFIGLLVALTILPLMHVASKAFSADWAINSGQVNILPVGFQFESIRHVISSKTFLTAFGNSLFATAAGTLCTLAITAFTAYPLSMLHLPFMKGALMLFVFNMFFTGGIIPTYLIYNSYGIVNTRASLIMPGLINVFHLLIIKNFYEDIPESIIESARLDGANSLRILIQFVMPLSKPVYATITVFTSVLLWNSYFEPPVYMPMMYINSPELQTLPLYLRDVIAGANNTQALSMLLIEKNLAAESITAAAIVTSTVPILLVYPFMQRHFVKGMTMGSTKG